MKKSQFPVAKFFSSYLYLHNESEKKLIGKSDFYPLAHRKPIFVNSLLFPSARFLGHRTFFIFFCFDTAGFRKWTKKSGEYKLLSQKSYDTDRITEMFSYISRRLYQSATAMCLALIRQLGYKCCTKFSGFSDRDFKIFYDYKMAYTTSGVRWTYLTRRGETRSSISQQLAYHLENQPLQWGGGGGGEA